MVGQQRRGLRCSPPRHSNSSLSPLRSTNRHRSRSPSPQRCRHSRTASLHAPQKSASLRRSRSPPNVSKEDLNNRCDSRHRDTSYHDDRSPGDHRSYQSHPYRPFYTRPQMNQRYQSNRQTPYVNNRPYRQPQRRSISPRRASHSPLRNGPVTRDSSRNHHQDHHSRSRSHNRATDILKTSRNTDSSISQMSHGNDRKCYRSPMRPSDDINPSDSFHSTNFNTGFPYRGRGRFRTPIRGGYRPPYRPSFNGPSTVGHSNFSPYDDDKHRTPSSSYRQPTRQQQYNRPVPWYVRHANGARLPSRNYQQTNQNSPPSSDITAPQHNQQHYTTSPEKWTHDKFATDSSSLRDDSFKESRPMINLYAESFDKLYEQT